MITAYDYFQDIAAIEVNKLPDALKKGHEFFVKSTANGSTWEAYENNHTVRKVIDLYLEKINQYLASQSKTKSKGQPKTKPERSKQSKPAIKQEGTNTKIPDPDSAIFYKAFQLLSKFIPGFVQNLRGKSSEKFTIKDAGELAIKDDGVIREIWLGFNRNAESDDSQTEIMLTDSIDGEQELQYDVNVYFDKEEAHVTGLVVSSYYEDNYGLDEDAKKEEEEGGDIGEPLTASMVEWLEDLLNGGHQMKLNDSSKGDRKKSTKAESAKPRTTKANKSKGVLKREVVRSKKVEHIREEVKFIKRYVSLHNKVKSPTSILSLIKSLQRSIVQKLIRKTSPLANEIRMIQDNLINAYNKAKGDLEITINDKDLARLVRIAGGEEVYPSINIIKRYVGMQGKEVDPAKIALFNKQIQNAISNKKVAGDDPYYDKVKAIHNTIQKLKAGQVVNIGKAELNGLEGIVKACGCKTSVGRIYDTGGKELRPCKTRTYSDSKSRGACSHNQGLNGVMTAEEMGNRQFERLNFTSPWDALIGKPAKNFTIMFHGEPGSGKTTLLLKFAEYLAINFGRVIYISSEEHEASTLTDKINELLKPKPVNLVFAPNLESVDLGDYDFIILDSVNDLALKLDAFKKLRKENPHAAFILILQHTKDGDYRGGKDWEHDIQIAAKVEGGAVTVYRSRYGVKGSLNFFQYFNTKPIQSALKPYALGGDTMTLKNEHY